MATDGAPLAGSPAVCGIRIATVGNVDAGKSTLVGCLSRGITDDGRGRARALVFHHKHELETGRTSTVATEIMGFDGDKALAVDLKASRAKLFQNVHEHADKHVTFVDLCGHEKYLKTTIWGMTGMAPDYAMVVVGSNMGVSRMTREHIGIAAALGLPLIIVVTKVDISPADVHAKTMETVAKVLKQARKLPLQIRASEHVAAAAKAIVADRITPVLCVSTVTGEGMANLRALLRLLPARVADLASRGETYTSRGPVGNGLTDSAAATATAAASAGSGGAATAADAITASGAAGPPATTAAAAVAPAAADSAAEGAAAACRSDVADTAPRIPPAVADSLPNESAAAGAGAAAEDAATTAPTTTAATAAAVPGESSIDSVFNVPGVGTVVAGTVMRGSIRVGATMLLGPDRSGEFTAVTIRSIHVQYSAVDEAFPGGSAAFAIRPKGKSAHNRGAASGKRGWVRKGMALVAPALVPAAAWEFSAEILVLHHSTTLQAGYTPVMHIGVCSQAAKITAMTAMDGAPLPALRTADRAVIRCRFMYRPEYIHAGDTLLFREGRAKGVGRVRALHGGGGGLAGESVGDGDDGDDPAAAAGVGGVGAGGVGAAAAAVAVAETSTVTAGIVSAPAAAADTDATAAR